MRLGEQETRGVEYLVDLSMKKGKLEYGCVCFANLNSN